MFVNWLVLTMDTPTAKSLAGKEPLTELKGTHWRDSPVTKRVEPRRASCLEVRVSKLQYAQDRKVTVDAGATCALDSPATACDNVWSRRERNRFGILREP